MYDPVHDGIRQCFFTDDLMPFFNRYLGGDDGSSFAMPVFNNIQQQGPALGIQGLDAKIIEDQGFSILDNSFRWVPSAFAILSWDSSFVVLA